LNKCHELKKLLPDLKDKRVLDLGCGFGWHCRYAVEQGARSAVGIDLSERMLGEARKKTKSDLIEYVRKPIEDIDYLPDTFDVVISSLAFHYIESFEGICDKVNNCLVKGGDFVFSVEHPVFTAYGAQDWFYDGQGNCLHWPVDKYFVEGIRTANFLGEEVLKYHKTLTTYVQGLIKAGFDITGLVEPKPEEKLLQANPGMIDELRRPMMLIIAARKK
jgi:SAM-dependent methyltransferase